MVYVPKVSLILTPSLDAERHVRTPYSLDLRLDRPEETDALNQIETSKAGTTTSLKMSSPLPCSIDVKTSVHTSEVL